MATDQKTKTPKATPVKPPQLTAAERRKLERKIATLEKEVRELEAELEATQEALSGQDLHIRKGYICTIHGPTDGWYVGCCPTLHAGSQGRTYEEASQELDYAIEAMIEAMAEWDVPLPPLDTEARCRN